MSLSDMKVYNDEIMGLTLELLAQDLNVFNAASGGAIRIEAGDWMGNFSAESFFQAMASAQRRVNRYGANSAATATDLTQSEIVAVKVAGGFGPMRFEPGQLTWLQKDPTAAIPAISKGFANAMLADQLNTAVAAAVAALSNVSGATHDVSATGGITQAALNGSHALFGDMSGLLTTQIMTGATYHNLIGQALANAEHLFSSQNVTVLGILGKRIVVSDIPALYEAGTPNLAKVLTLTNGGVVVDGTSDINSNIQTANGKQRIETTFQADYSFGLRIKGFAWDTANGGASPDDAALATGANWIKAVDSVKHLAGVCLIGDATK